MNIKKRSQILAILFSVIMMFVLTGCVEDESSKWIVGDCTDAARNAWLVQGNIVPSIYNSTKDIRGYYLNNRDSASLHRFDGMNIKVWGFRFVGKYSDEPYYDSVTGDPVLLIALSPRPLRYERYGNVNPNSDYGYLNDTAIVIVSGNKIVNDDITPLTDTIHAFVRGSNIERVLSNPDKALLMSGALEVKQTYAHRWWNCFGLPDCSVGLEVVNLEIP